MRIGIVTDEISPDLDLAFLQGLEWGIKDYELRCAGSRRVPFFNQQDIDIIQKHREQAGIRITALSPGVFKVSLSNQDVIRKELEKTLPQCFQLAKTLDCRQIIIFGFHRDGDITEEDYGLVIHYLSRAVELAREHGMTLLIENEPGCWCDTGTATTSVLEAVGSPCLLANWDPANAVGQGETPFPNGYEKIKKYVANLHIKDAPVDSMKECVPVGDGVVDWEGQLEAVCKDGQLEHVTIETHCLPLLEKSKLNIDRIRLMLDKFA